MSRSASLSQNRRPRRGSHEDTRKERSCVHVIPVPDSRRHLVRRWRRGIGVAR